MADFQIEVDKIFKREGGYVDYENDGGGATNMGITIGTLSRWRNRKISKSEVKALTKDEAVKIYRSYYWDPIRASEIKSQLIAGILFDQAVNRGIKTAARNLQQAYNDISEVKIGEDGIIGTESLKAFNFIDEGMLAVTYFKDMQRDYVEIVKKNPSQIVFLKGWINRTHSVLNSIITYFTAKKPSEAVTDSWILKLIDTIAEFFISKEGNIEEKPTTILEKILFHNPTFEKHEIKRALSFLENRKVTNHGYFLYNDFDLHDMDKRAFLIDLETGKTYRKELVAHGANSDKNKDGYPESFSNIPGSHQSSLGAMVTGEEYGKSVGGYSKFNYARILHGLERGLNDKVKSRAMVLHNASYVDSGGDSWGCLAFSNTAAPFMIKHLKEGTLVYTNHKSLHSKEK